MPRDNLGRGSLFPPKTHTSKTPQMTQDYVHFREEALERGVHVADDIWWVGWLEREIWKRGC